MKKTDNKGFSLVELIIVIAIMAILIGVLAPQYMKYVEKSRTSADKDTLDSVYNACTVASADPETSADEPSAGTITSLPAGKNWSSAVKETLGGMDLSDVNSKLKSKSAKGGSGSGTASTHISIDANQNYTVWSGTITVPEN